ncbi:unnamed protein product [Cuscuta europaea]|uniref:Uncharacterized protein n=1 Tax=Cuscuta europaea TaxID=41803 RepID=A0A9P0ZK39_CUSEU|nr:unnamed protein product [Cuscuta europaea]
MTLEDLTGSLMTYELGLQEEQDAENVRKERGIALKAREEEEESESQSEYEMSMFAKKFEKMYWQFKSNRNKQGLCLMANSDEESDQENFKGLPTHILPLLHSGSIGPKMGPAQQNEALSSPQFTYGVHSAPWTKATVYRFELRNITGEQGYSPQ